MRCSSAAIPSAAGASGGAASVASGVSGAAGAAVGDVSGDHCALGWGVASSSVMRLPLLVNSIQVGQQVVEHLGHVAHDGDGAAVLHACWADDAEQAGGLALDAIARDDHAHVFERLGLVL